MSEPAALKPKPPFGVIFLVLFLDLVGFSILFPLYPFILEHYLHQDSALLGGILAWIKQGWPEASPVQTAALFGGLLGSGYALLQFITAPMWGRLSDRIGRRPVLFCSLAGSTVSYLIWAISGSFYLLLVSRLIAGRRLTAAGRNWRSSSARAIWTRVWGRMTKVAAPAPSARARPT